MAAPRKRAPKSIAQQDLKPSFSRPGVGAAQTVDVQMSFDAAGVGRRLSGWRPSLKGPNRDNKGLQPLRNRSRDSQNNDWAGRRSGTVWSTQLIGIGIKARFDKIVSKERRKEVQALYDKHLNECDADGVSHWYAMQTLAVSSKFYAGEVFLRVRPRDFTLPLAVPVQYQMLESEMCPADFDTDAWTGLPEGNRIVSGIELNKYDRRIAYWFYKYHPAEDVSIRTPTAGELVRVAASEIWHIYRPARPGALRGVSQLHAVLTRLRATGDFEDAVLDRQKLANLFTLFITKTLPPEFWQGEPVDSLTGMPKVWNGSAPVANLEPGMGVELRPGEDVRFANPPEAGTTYSDYLRSTWLGTAAGSDIPYELLTGDVKDISDRALRVLLNEFHRLMEGEQWQIIIPKMCQPFVESFAKFALIAGLITFDEAELIKQCTHAPHAWAYVHPVQDVQGDAMAVEKGLKARSTWQNERGYDPDAEDELRAADRKREDELGLNEPTAAQKAATEAKATGQKAAKNNQAQARVEQREFLATIAASTKPVPSSITVEAPQITVQPPSVNVTNNLPAPAVDIVNQIPAPIVNVQTEVTTPPTQVDVQNNIPAPIVNVTPGEVHVTNEVNPEVTVNLPTRVTTSNVVRDSDGNIIKVTQTETTKESKS